MGEMQLEIPAFSDEEGERRHRKIRELMQLRGIDCLIIAGHLGTFKSKGANIRYVSNICPSSDEHYIIFPLEGEALYLSWVDRQIPWEQKTSWIPLKAVSLKRTRERDYAGDIVGRIENWAWKRLQ